MTSAQKINCLIAEKVFGFVYVNDTECADGETIKGSIKYSLLCSPEDAKIWVSSFTDAVIAPEPWADVTPHGVPDFWNDLFAAMQILEKSSGMWELQRVWTDDGKGFDHTCYVRFGDNTQSRGGKTASQAICKAALRCFGIEV